MVSCTGSVPEAGRREGSVGIPAGATLPDPCGRTTRLGCSIEPEVLLGDPGSSEEQAGPSWGGELSRWARWHPDTAFPGGRFREQKGKSLGRREARFINQGLRITRVAFTAPPVPVRCWGMMQSPWPARLCSRSISAPPVS